MAYLLHHGLAGRAARQPECEAVRYGTCRLTYGELEELTNKLARALSTRGVRRGDRVGIYLHKSLASIVAVFGIMKTGATYVPVDADGPPARAAYVVGNCGIQVLVTSAGVSRLSPLLAESPDLHTLVLTDDEEPSRLPTSVGLVRWSDVLQQSDAPVASCGSIDTDLAYILYTSGSTGEPKGVMISHRAILTFVNWCCTEFRMTPADRTTGHAPLHFDLSTFDIYVTLQAGGTLVLVPETLSVLPEQLTRLLQNERITVSYLVPSVLSLLVTYGHLEAHDLSTLRAVLFAGEVFPIKYLRQLVRAIPHAEYYNLYGPTETNVCTFHRVQPADLDPDQDRPLPIGIPCDNVEVFAVDAQQRLVTSPGQEGELWVRGACVAHGYWGDAARTAGRFVRNPFQPHFDDIAYRTGDIVTLAEDGANWVYVGRSDHLVKSRGYRIELGEIESVVYSERRVKEAAVIAVPDDLVGNRITAFVVPLPGGNLTRQDLEAHCRRRLPRYMIPDTVIFCEALPRTSSGKIDRQRLSQMHSGRDHHAHGSDHYRIH